MAKPKAPKPNTASKPIRGKSYSVDYESLDNPPKALRGHIDPLYRHPVEAETIRGRQVQKLQEAVQKGGERLQSVADHLAFVAAQADPSKPGADFTNLAPYMEALEQLPVHQRKIILDAAGNPAVFASVLDKEMPALTIGQGDTSWADDLFAGEAAPAQDAPEQPVFASSIGDVQDPDTQPGVVYSDVFEDRSQHPQEFRYSTYAGSKTARDKFRLEGRAARASGGLDEHPLIYDQMQEIKRIEKAGKIPVLPPVGKPVKHDLLRGASPQSYSALVREIERVRDIPVDPQRFDAENDYVAPPSRPLNFIDVLPDDVSGRMTGRRHQLRLTGPEELAGTAGPPEPVDRMAGVDSRTPFEERIPTVFRTQAEKDGALATLQSRLSEIERRIAAIPDDLEQRRAAYVPQETEVLTVGTGAVGERTPLWSEKKPFSLDIEVERRMRPALDKTVAKIEDLADRAAYGDANAIVDLDRLYPRWRAVLPEVDADGNVTPSTRPPSGQLLGGLIANAANIGDPGFSRRVADILDRSIRAQASLPPSTDMARQYAAMQLTPGRDGIKYLSGLAKSGQYPFPFFADTNVPAFRAAPEAADWADDLVGPSDPVSGQIDAGEAWADQLFAEEAAKAAPDAQPAMGDDANWADQLDMPAAQPLPQQDSGMGWADESLGTDFVAPEPPSSDTNWADDFSMYGDPAIQGFAALDTMNRRRAQNPLAALLA